MAVNFINPHDIMFFDATGKMASDRLDPVRVSPLKPAPLADIYADDLRLPLPESFHDDLSQKPGAQQDDQRWLQVMFGKMARDDEAAWNNYRNYYYNCIRDVDRHIGTVLDALNASGQADSTIVVFTSDHGEMAGAHGMRQKGPSVYKENVRVSLMIRHPDISQPTETSALGTTLDLVPTLLDFAGVDAAKCKERWPDLKGISLTPALNGSQTERDERGIFYNYTTNLTWDPELVETVCRGQVRGDFTGEERQRLSQGISRDNYSCFRGIYDGRYKLARYFKPSEHHQPDTWDMLTSHNQLELFDTLEDPHECANLASDPESHRELIESLNSQLNALIRQEVGVDDGSCYGAEGFKLSA